MFIGSVTDVYSIDFFKSFLKQHFTEQSDTITEFVKGQDMGCAKVVHFLFTWPSCFFSSNIS